METAFSGGSALEALRFKGADVAVQDPLYDDAKLGQLGFAP